MVARLILYDSSSLHNEVSIGNGAGEVKESKKGIAAGKAGIELLPQNGTGHYFQDTYGGSYCNYVVSLKG
jgi:hypothetical protein